MKSNFNNPLVIQALNSLDLLQTYLEEYKITNKTEVVPLEVIHLYSGNIIKNAKKGREELLLATELESFDFLISEIDIMFSVIGGSCIKYCEEIGSDEVPEDILNNYFSQMILKVSE